MHVNLENLADAQSIADNLALLPKEALLYIAGYAEGRRDRPARKRKKKDSTNGEKEARPWRGGTERTGGGLGTDKTNQEDFRILNEKALEESGELAFSVSTVFQKISEQKKRLIFIKSILIMLVTSVGFASVAHFAFCYFSQFFQ